MGYFIDYPIIPLVKRRADAYKKFRLRLIQKRKESGLTQAQLAVKIGQAQNFVSKYETGERRLDAVEVIYILNALKVSVEDFFKKVAQEI